MTGARTDPAAALRGVSVGVLTAALAVAAHGTAGGGWPGGAGTAQLALLAVTLGAVASRVRATTGALALSGLLGVGQLLAHVLLAIDGHAHRSHPLQPSVFMLVAHLVAVTIGALLITGGTRLCAALSRTVRAMVRPAHPRSEPATRAAVRSADQPLHSARLLGSSMSHRGPPVGVIR
ncbi:hypothetical protein [Mycobacterium sp. 155]|uniref:hypothetical protein n=1 Tax=Mycobacterium sp. 155 TaxID=1157943 RepID=UPI00036246C0|nr:hypothetical protein [Mycobacterium sp. 155]